MARKKPVVLIVIDGFGVAPPGDGNAVYRARMPVFQRLVENYPAMTLQASGEAVGLSWGEMGNSQVGHIAIGAGQVFFQNLLRLNHAIQDGSFFTNTILKKAIAEAQAAGKALHLVGLVSSGGVHSSQEHLHALLELCRREGFTRVFVHAILDGRDALFNSGAMFIEELEEKMKELKAGEIASLSGRFFAMDRDNHWERIEPAYLAMTLGQGPRFPSALAGIQASYAAGVYDEQMIPFVVEKNGNPVATIQPGDSVIFFNFRPDRARELTKAFVLPAFDRFSRPYLTPLFFVTMMEYEADLPVEVAFPPERIDMCLARVVSDAGLRQLHIAETEKYAHVTFFLNGMREDPFPGEDRVIIPSPRVSTYDQAPAMSIQAITDRMVKEIGAGSYDFLVANFANPDMVGHTGNIEATITACEVVDKCLGHVVEAALAVHGAVVITADHGNAEEVTNLMTGEMDKEHSTNPVPCIIVSKDLEGVKAPTEDAFGNDLSLTAPLGVLADVAPTVCKLLEIPPAKEMTGRALI